MIMDGWQTINYLDKCEFKKKDNVVVAIAINEGMTIYMSNINSFFEAKEKLDEAGFEITTNIDNYSIYIVSAPYEYKYNETIYRIK